MDEFNIEVSNLKHNFWQILNLSKQLLARNEVLKAKLKEQEKSFEWKLTEMQKTIEDLKRKNNILQKKLATDEDGLSVVSKDYEDVVKGSLSQVSPREYQEIKPDLARINPDEKEETYSEDSNSVNSI